MTRDEWLAALRAAARACPVAEDADAAPVVEVRIAPTGERAEAEGPDAAVYAARVLLREAMDAGCGDPRASFVVAGKLVRGGLRLREV